MNFFGFPIKLATPAEIMAGIARAKRIYADENIIAAQDRDGMIYIDENRAGDDLSKSGSLKGAFR